MEILKDIKAFIDTPEQEKDYSVAVALLKHCGNRAIGLSRRGASRSGVVHPKFHSLFLKELERFYNQQSNKKPKAASAPVAKVGAPAKADSAPVTSKTPADYVAPPVTKLFSDEEYAKLPSDVKELSNANVTTQKVRAKAKAALDGAKDDESRRLIAEEIHNLTQIIDQNFAALEYYKTNGQLPEVSAAVEEETLTLAAVIRLKQNASARRSKAKAAAAKAKTRATKEKQEAKFAEEDAEVLRLEALEKKLSENESLSNTEG